MENEHVFLGILYLVYLCYLLWVYAHTVGKSLTRNLLINNKNQIKFQTYQTRSKSQFCVSLFFTSVIFTIFTVVTLGLTVAALLSTLSLL